MQITESTQCSGKGQTSRKSRKKPNSSGKGDKQAEKTNVVSTQSKAQYPRYESLEVCQKVVQRARRSVYAHLHKITNAHINLAAAGNCQSAKFLFEFAGIDDLATLPVVNQAEPPASEPVTAANAGKQDPEKAVLSFYKKLGMEPPVLLPRGESSASVDGPGEAAG